MTLHRSSAHFGPAYLSKAWSSKGAVAMDDQKKSLAHGEKAPWNEKHSEKLVRTLERKVRINKQTN